MVKKWGERVTLKDLEEFNWDCSCNEGPGEETKAVFIKDIKADIIKTCKELKERIDGVFVTENNGENCICGEPFDEYGECPHSHVRGGDVTVKSFQDELTQSELKARLYALMEWAGITESELK